MELTIYTFGFPGVVMGGTAVIAARDARKARHMLLKDPKIIALNLSNKDIDLLISQKLDKEQFIYFDNGDY